MTSDDRGPLTKDLIDRLRVYCDQERGRSRVVAAELGVTPSSLSDWLNGRTVPTLENGLRIQQILAKARRKRQ